MEQHNVPRHDLKTRRRKSDFRMPEGASSSSSSSSSSEQNDEDVGARGPPSDPLGAPHCGSEVFPHFLLESCDLDLMRKMMMRMMRMSILNLDEDDEDDEDAEDDEDEHPELGNHEEFIG